MAETQFPFKSYGVVKTMQTEYALVRAGLVAVLVAAADRIFAEGNMKYSGAQLMQQLGLYTTIIVMTEHGEEVNAGTLTERTRLHYMTVNKMLKSLYDAKIIGRTQVQTSHGGGRKYIYHPLVDIRVMAEAPHSGIPST